LAGSISFLDQVEIVHGAARSCGLAAHPFGCAIRLARPRLAELEKSVARRIVAVGGDRRGCPFRPSCSWVSLTRRGLPDAVGDVIEPLLHFLGYAVLVGFVSMACRSFTTLIYIFFAAIGIGVALELVQLLIPERGASFVDLTMNVLGACAGCLLGAACLKRQSRLQDSAQGR
jgi:hypothetical protein